MDADELFDISEFEQIHDAIESVNYENRKDK